MGRDQLLAAITEAGWNVAAAAAGLGLHANTLRHRLRVAGIQRPPRAAPTAVAASDVSQLDTAAKTLHELRSRAVLIRDSKRLTPAQREQARRVLAAEMLQASMRYRALAASAAANLPPAAVATMHGAHRQW